MDAISFLSSIPSLKHFRQAEKQVATSDSICIPSWGCAYDFVPEADPCILFEYEDVIECVSECVSEGASECTGPAEQAVEVVKDDFPELLVEEFEFPVYSPTIGPCFGYEDLDLDAFRLSPEAIAILRGDEYETIAEAKLVTEVEAVSEVEAETVVEVETVAEVEAETVAEVEAVPVVEVESVAELEVETVADVEAVSEVEVETVADVETVALAASAVIIDLTLEDSSSEEEEEEELPRKRARVCRDVIVIDDSSEDDN
jgi:hypothetical protein